MKPLAALILLFALASCAKSETDTLRDNNQRLEKELQAVTQERDTYKAQLDKIRQVLENPSAATTPETSSPDSSAAPNPDPNTGSGMAAPPLAAPEAPTSPAPNALPAPTPPTSPAPGGNTATSSEAAAKLKAYAENVLSAAQNYKAQNRQEPPTDCADGYEAGDYRVEDAEGIADQCSVSSKGDGSYSVTVKDADGTSVSVP